MKRIRIIPRLDIKGDNLVKGINLEGLRVLGKPYDFARLYYEQGADELLLVDVVASLYGRKSIIEIIEKTAKETFIPLTVAGGIRSLSDIADVLNSGADKVAINSAAIARPDLLGEAVQRYGSSTIVLSLEVGKNLQGNFEVLVEYGRESTGLDPIDWVKKAAAYGVGEILLTCVSSEGMSKGLNLELVRTISEMVSIPVIACGGVGDCEDVRKGFTDGKASAVAIASAFHYFYLDQIKLDPQEYNKEGNISFLVKNPDKSRNAGFSFTELREYLKLHDLFMHSI